MFDWEDSFVKDLVKENPKDKQQARYKGIKKSLKDGTEMWANLTKTLESEAQGAFDAALPQLTPVLALDTSLHDRSVRKCVSQALDESVLTPMRRWLVEQVALDPETMPEEEDNGDENRPYRPPSRVASIESASTVGDTQGERVDSSAMTQAGSAKVMLDRQLHCLSYLASRLYMRVRDAGSLDKGVEERMKAFEDQMQKNLQRGKREGAKEQKMREALEKERNDIWDPVHRLMELLEPAVQRLAKAVGDLTNARVTQAAIGRIPDAVLWGSCNWKLTQARAPVKDVELRWRSIREGVAPEVWAAMMETSTAGMVDRVEQGVDSVVSMVPKIEGLLGASSGPLVVEEVLQAQERTTREKRMNKLGGLSQACAGLSQQQLQDAALIGKLLADLSERVHVISSSSLWYVQEEIGRVELSVPPSEPPHAFQKAAEEEALAELFVGLPQPIEAEGAWEEAGHVAMQRLHGLAKRARDEAAALDALVDTAFGRSVQPVADWLYEHADAALDILDEPSESIAREWATAFIEGEGPDPEAFEKAALRTKPPPEGSIDIRKVTKQRATFAFLRGLHVLLKRRDVRQLAGGMAF